MYGHVMVSRDSTIHVLGVEGHWTWSDGWHKVSPRGLGGRFYCVTPHGQDRDVVVVVGGQRDMVSDPQQHPKSHPICILHPRCTSTLNHLSQEDSLAIHLVSDARVPFLPSPGLLSSQLVLVDSTLYLTGGFNGTVHSAVLSLDTSLSICLSITGMDMRWVGAAEGEEDRRMGIR